MEEFLSASGGDDRRIVLLEAGKEGERIPGAYVR